MELSQPNLHLLTMAYYNDKSSLNEILKVIESFVDYHMAIYKMETTLKFNLFMGIANYSETQAILDNERSRCHNIVIEGMRTLNKMANKRGIEPIYAGKVSEAPPYRRELADAVLCYVNDVVVNRI